MNAKNVILILSDDQGAWALGAAGNEELKTPNLDKLAARGRRFTNFFCASPVCSPARASILTGQIPSKHGVLDWIRSGSMDRELMKERNVQNPYGGYSSEDKPIQYLADQRCYTDALYEAGYNVALSGKWHLGDSMTPQHGFKRWYTIGKGGAHYFHPDIIENGEVTIENTYVTDLFTKRALEFIEEMRQEDKPFYLNINYTAPHDPWGPEHHKEEDLALYNDCPFLSTPDIPDHPHGTRGPVYGTPTRQENLRGYYAAITAMDRSIGEVMAYLETHNLLENTYVFFMADNGMNMGHHGIWGKGNGTFPQNMYEESVKVPFIALLPEEDTPGQVIDQMCSQIDFYPTLLDLLDIEDAHVETLPGKSMKPLLSGTPGTQEIHEELFICEEYGTVRMLREQRYKYIHRYPFGHHELYDLLEDPREENNLYGLPEQEERILEMRKKLETWFSKYMDPAKDGAKEGVTGLGQLTQLGSSADKVERFYIEATK